MLNATEPIRVWPDRYSYPNTYNGMREGAIADQTLSFQRLQNVNLFENSCSSPLSIIDSSLSDYLIHLSGRGKKMNNIKTHKSHVCNHLSTQNKSLEKWNFNRKGEAQ